MEDKREGAALGTMHATQHPPKSCNTSKSEPATPTICAAEGCRRHANKNKASPEFMLYCYDHRHLAPSVPSCLHTEYEEYEEYKYYAAKPRTASEGSPPPYVPLCDRDIDRAGRDWCYEWLQSHRYRELNERAATACPVAVAGTPGTSKHTRRIFNEAEMSARAAILLKCREALSKNIKACHQNLNNDYLDGYCTSRTASKETITKLKKMQRESTDFTIAACQFDADEQFAIEAKARAAWLRHKKLAEEQLAIMKKAHAKALLFLKDKREAEGWKRKEMEQD